MKNIIFQTQNPKFLVKENSHHIIVIIEKENLSHGISFFKIYELHVFSSLISKGLGL